MMKQTFVLLALLAVAAFSYISMTAGNNTVTIETAIGTADGDYLPNVGKELLGEWRWLSKSNSIDEEEISYGRIGVEQTTRFLKNGTYQTKNQNSSNQRAGEWQFSARNQTLVLVDNQSKQEENFELELEGDRLILKKHNETIQLVRN